MAQVQYETQKLQKLQLQERLREKQAKLALQQQHDNGLHSLLGRSMGRLEATKDALMLADEQVQRFTMCGGRGARRASARVTRVQDGEEPGTSGAEPAARVPGQEPGADADAAAVPDGPGGHGDV